MKQIAVVLLIALAIVSCKKKTEKDTVNGVVTDIADNHAVSGATVEIQAKLIGTSSYQSAFSTLAYGVTDASGNYNLEFDREKATTYRIRVSLNGYLTTEYEFSPDQLENGSFSHNISIPANGWITVHVSCGYPYDHTVEFTMRFKNIPAGIPNTCSSSMFYYSGIIEDTIPVCFVPGGLNLIIEKNLHFYSSNVQTFDTVYIPQGDTVVHQIFY
jgi:hypothetical protein